jgi:DNA invertase Pin-like site-specific DNA recombinase
MQLLDLRGFVERMGYEAIEYIEKESSVKHRPVFERMLDDARQRKFDVVLVWKIDRFARSMQQFVNTVTELSRFGICLRSITQNVSSDQNDPMGRFLLGLLSLLAELERNIIVERVRAGMKAAKHRGVHCGRRKAVFDRTQVLELYLRGKENFDIEGLRQRLWRMDEVMLLRWGQAAAAVSVESGPPPFNWIMLCL